MASLHLRSIGDRQVVQQQRKSDDTHGDQCCEVIQDGCGDWGMCEGGTALRHTSYCAVTTQCLSESFATYLGKVSDSHSQ